MKLTKGKAIELFKRQWTDMQKELGDTPCSDDREDFKEKWCKEHFPNEIIICDCFLCEYDGQQDNGTSSILCHYCPIDWGNNGDGKHYANCENGIVNYKKSPISEILSLPERNIDK